MWLQDLIHACGLHNSLILSACTLGWDLAVVTANVIPFTVYWIDSGSDDFCDNETNIECSCSC